MKSIGIIPSRFKSTRFPGKPLACICGKPMIQRVYEQAILALEEVWVATDDQRIADVVTGFGGKVVMTSTEHRSGTDRCAEAALKISAITGDVYNSVLNIQGDEPFISPHAINLVKKCLNHSVNTEIATLVQPIVKNEDIFNPDLVKVVFDKQYNAIYFSRSPIPHIARVNQSEWLHHHTFYGHVGLYAFRFSTLQKLARLSQGPIEKMESLEQLRWLENGFRIKTSVGCAENFGVDTPEDLALANELGIGRY